MHTIKIMLGVLLLAGCNNLPASQVPSATIMPPPNIAFTSTPTFVPTRTQEPTRTVTPVPAWVSEFAEPILSAIAGFQPTINDDFHDNSGGWHSDLNRVDHLAPIKFIDGELVLNNCDAYRSKMGYKDFVLEVDGRFVQGTKGNPDWRLVFRAQGPADPQYAIFINFAGYLDISMHDENFQSDPLYVNRGPENNHILLIARGSRFALYVNGRPLYYWQHTRINQGGYIYFDATTDNHGEAIIALDNLKIWDISKLP